MIIQSGDIPREPAPPRPRLPDAAGKAPGPSFQQLLAGPDEAGSGLLDAGSAAGPDSDPGSRGAEMFNERGLFAHSGNYEATPARAVHTRPGQAPDAGNLLPPGVQEAPVNSLPGEQPRQVLAPVPAVPKDVAKLPATAKALSAQVPSVREARPIPVTSTSARFDVSVETGDLEPGAVPSQARRSPVQRAATSRVSVSLSEALGSVTAAAQARELTAEERHRLEQRIAGELARHGLAIGRIVVSAPAAVRDQD
jgi:hypothetical protein